MMGNQDHFVEGGYIILSRQLLESRAWKSCNHKQKVMLITSLLNANHKDKAWWNGKEYVDVKKSSFITSRDKFARNTDTTPRKVRTFWNKMEKVGFLTIKSTKQYSVVNICNYNIYQDPKIYKRPSKRQSSDQAATTNNNDKERKEIYSAAFESIWKDYPSLLGKGKAYGHFQKSVESEKDLENIKKALHNYKHHLRVKTWKSAQNGSTWFKNWKEWVDYQEEEKADKSFAMD